MASPRANPGELLPIHRRAIELLAQGNKPARVAADLELSVDSIRKLKKHPMYSHEMARIQRELEQATKESASIRLTRAAGILDGATVLAAKKLRRLIRSKDENIALRAAKEVLDMRMPSKTKDGGDEAFRGARMDAETMQIFVNALKESGRQPIFKDGKIIAEEIPHAGIADGRVPGDGGELRGDADAVRGGGPGLPGGASGPSGQQAGGGADFLPDPNDFDPDAGAGG